MKARRDLHRQIDDDKTPRSVSLRRFEISNLKFKYLRENQTLGSVGLLGFTYFANISAKTNF